MGEKGGGKGRGGEGRREERRLLSPLENET